MNAGVIGGGAIGLLFAAYLSRTHCITIYTNTEEQAAAIRENGITLLKGSAPLQSFPGATASRHYKEELLIVTVKQFQLPSVLENLSPSHPKTLLFLQNGMGHIHSLSELRGHNLYTGSVSHGAFKRSLNEVRHNGSGGTVYSAFSAEGAAHDEGLIQSLGTEDFPFLLAPDWYIVLAEKLLVNACVNPLTGLLKVRNGELIDNPHYLHLLKKVFNEAFEILELPDKTKQWENVQKVCSMTSDNTSSMLQDLANGRKTEIEGIAGFLLEEAAKKRVQAPILDFTYKAIKGMESM
ncbi:2-dehydropantoate 2-reductase [Metabacillus sp. 113a]|uniref:2-dehydropantoate 2-reductase n=1 Tax=Metabacillus sp. 113a TaxID=3404706 RepID=UPI003CE6D8D7